jgi:hypothetical protein
MSGMINHIYILFSILILALFGAGCGGATGNSGFPAQTVISSDEGMIQGRVTLPAEVNSDYLQKSRGSVISASVGQISDFNGFVVYAQYVKDGVVTKVEGIINPEDGMYVIEGIPLEKEIKILVVRGRVTMLGYVPPLTRASNRITKSIDVQSTAESLIYEKIKERNSSATYAEESNKQMFQEQKLEVATLIQKELKNENVEDSITDILEQETILNGASEVADAIVDNEPDLNHLPYVLFDAVEQEQRGRVEVSFRLFDPENDAADAALYYTKDGNTFFPARQSSENYLSLLSLSTDRDVGIPYSLSWETAADLSVGVVNNVQLRLVVWPASEAATESNTNSSKTVFFSVDNRGLPEIISINIEEHQIGVESPVTVQGNNLSVVREVYLEYFGENSFVSPRRFTIAGSPVVSGQILSFTIPKWGLFPVPYKVGLKGVQDGDNSVSEKEISVYEGGAPSFDPPVIYSDLQPDSGLNHEMTQISFRGSNLFGTYGDDSAQLISLNDGSVYPLTPVSLELVNSESGDVKWYGNVPTGLPVGDYHISVKNHCTPVATCGGWVTVTDNSQGNNAEVYSVQEDVPVISAVNLVLSEGTGFNSTDNVIQLSGMNFYSVSQVKYATSREQLLSSFDSVSLSGTVSSVTYDTAVVKIPKGADPGTYFVGLKNMAGVAASLQTITIYEAAVDPQGVTISIHPGGDCGQPALVPGTPMNNLDTYCIKIFGENLASLSSVNFVNQDLSGRNLMRAPVTTSFTQAIVSFPIQQSPGRYRMDLTNAAGPSIVRCGGVSCFTVQEDYPNISSYLLPPPKVSWLSNMPKMMLSDDTYKAIQISGSNLAGTTSMSLCTSTAYENCLYVNKNPGASFVQASADFSSFGTLKPGTYYVGVANTRGVSFTPSNEFLQVVEDTPEITGYGPKKSFSSAELQGDYTLEFVGDYLLGVQKIYLTTTCASTVSSPRLTFANSQGVTYFNAVDNSHLQFFMQGAVDVPPGNYYWAVENLAPYIKSRFSACDPGIHMFSVTEPELVFLYYSTGSASNISVPNYQVTTVGVVGQYLHGLDQVLLKYRDAVTNYNPNVYAQVINTAANSASFEVPPGMLPGTWELWMKNSSMSNPKYVAATMTLTETGPGIIEHLVFQNNLNENVSEMYLDLSGQHLEGVGLSSKLIWLVDKQDMLSGQLPQSNVQLIVTVEGDRYVRVKIPAGTPGGDYFVSVQNTHGVSSTLTETASIVIREPKAVFESLAVIGPFDDEYGFGENNKKMRIEIRGEHLNSVTRIELTRELESSDETEFTTYIEKSDITRVINSGDMTLVVTVPPFLRPGYYDVRLLNNNSESQWSDTLNVQSPFFEQVLVREGAPILDAVGCIDEGPAAIAANSDCKEDYQIFSIITTQDLMLTGRNFYTLSNVKIYEDDNPSVPVYEYELPPLGSYLPSNGVLYHTSKAVTLDLPQFLRHIGYYHIELTNSSSTLRYKSRMKTEELEDAFINTINPNGSSGAKILNSNTTVLSVSGGHFTGVTMPDDVVLMAENATLSSTPVMNLPYQVIEESNYPYRRMQVTIPKEVVPGTYQLVILNTTRGFNMGGNSHYISISEPNPSVSQLFPSEIYNSTAQSIKVTGIGFLGLDTITLEPWDTSPYDDANEDMSINHFDIVLSEDNINIVSATEMELTVPAWQLPGYYRLSLVNTTETTYNYNGAVQIKETTPVIDTVSPDKSYYSTTVTMIVSGEGFLGVRGTTSSDTWGKLVHTESGVDFERVLDDSVIVGAPTSDTIRFIIEPDLEIGRYELQIKNSHSIASSLTVTSFEIEEGEASLDTISRTTFPYNFLKCNIATEGCAGGTWVPDSRTFDITGQHLKGVHRMWISTDMLSPFHNNETLEYEVNLGLASSSSITGCEISTGFVYPGIYELHMENYASANGGHYFSTSIHLDFMIPEGQSSSVTNFSPKSSAFNGPIDLYLTGNNLRRMEYLALKRISILNSVSTTPQDILTVVDVENSIFPPEGEYEEIGDSIVHAVVRPPSPDTKFDDGGLTNKNRATIKYKTWFMDSPEETTLSNFFEFSGVLPVISGFTECSSGPISKTTVYTGSTGQAVCETDVMSATSDSYLPLQITGSNFQNVSAVKLVQDSMEWTIACTTGTGASALNQGETTSVNVSIPLTIFTESDMLNEYCNNDTSLRPLLPGIFTIIVEDDLGNSSRYQDAAKFYFSEGYPAISVLNLDEGFTTQNVLVQVQGENLLGSDQVTFFKSQYGSVSRTYSLTRGTLYPGQTAPLKFTVPKGTLRGLKRYGELDSYYSVSLRNSRGSTTDNLGQFKMKEVAPDLTKLTPTYASVSTSNPVIFEGQGSSLLGVGQDIGNVGGIANNKNRIKLLYKDAYLEDDISLVTGFTRIDITDSVTAVELTSFIAVIPKNIMPGEWIFSVENDHYSTDNNPVIKTDRIYTAKPSPPDVSVFSPQVSDFDSLPSVLALTGEFLSGLRKAFLDLESGPNLKQETLSLVGAPDLTGVTFDSAKFVLPTTNTDGSAYYMQPGTYAVRLIDLDGEEYILPERLTIYEKPPVLTRVIPDSGHYYNFGSLAEFDNSVEESFDVSGLNLFGYPSMSVSRNGETYPISINEEVVQSQDRLEGLTMPHSLFPGDWILTVENSVGSTSITVVVTEPVAVVSAIQPDTVSFDSRTPIVITGDHFISALGTPGSIVLSDVLKTPLEDIVLVDRYEIHATVPAGVNVGRYEVLISNLGGVNTTSALLTVSGNGPQVDLISPATDTYRGGAFAYITGSGFVAGTRVVIGGTMAMDVQVSPERLEFFIPPMSNSIAIDSGSALVDVQVFNPDGTSTLKSGFFTYTKDTSGRPSVVTVFPGAFSGNGPTGKARDTKIAVYFNEEMSPDSFLLKPDPAGMYNAFTVLTGGALTVNTTWTWNDSHEMLVYQYNQDFLSEQKVEVGFSNLLTSSTGKILLTTDEIDADSSSPYKLNSKFVEDWSFTTGAGVDASGFQIVSPANGSVLSDFGVTETVTIVFNKEINPLTIKEEDLLLRDMTDSDRPVRINVGYKVAQDGMSLVLDPQEVLTPNHSYELKLDSTEMESLTSKSLDNWLALLETKQTGPIVTKSYPVDGATSIPLNTLVIVHFDQAIEEATVNSSNFQIKDGSSQLEGSFSFSDDLKIVTFRANDGYENDTEYTVDVSNRIKSDSGIPLTVGFSFDFRTSGSNYRDLEAPHVASVYPSNGQTGVSTGVTVIATFTEPVHPEELTAANFSLTRVDGAVSPVYSLTADSSGRTVYLTPEDALLYDRAYKFTIAGNIRDLADNEMANNVVSQFTIESHMDQDGPTVTWIAPAHGAQNISVTTSITVIFDEPINVDDANNKSYFHLKLPDNSNVTGNLMPYGTEQITKIEFLPTILHKNTDYVFEISGSVRDLVGNTMSEITTFTFKTEDWVDNIAPIIDLVTVNGLPQELNGYNSSGLPSSVRNNSGVFETPEIYVPETGFTIDIYHHDPGEAGESSGIDLDSIIINDEKVVTSNNSVLVGNIFAHISGGYSRQQEQTHTRLIVPSNIKFADGPHTLEVTVQDGKGINSPQKEFSFQVVSKASEPQYYPFESNNGAVPVSTFVLDFSAAKYKLLGSVRLGTLRIDSEFVPDGDADFLEEMWILGLMYCIPGNCEDGLENRDTWVDSLPDMLEQMIVDEANLRFRTRADGSSMGAGDPSLPIINFTTTATPDAVIMAIGGDNGEEAEGVSTIVKSVERSVYNTANSLSAASIDLTVRSAQREQGYGVFTTHLIRKYANDTAGYPEWLARMAPVSRFAFTGTNNQLGTPIGTYEEDETYLQAVINMKNNNPELDCFRFYDSEARQQCRLNQPAGVPANFQTRSWQMYDAMSSYARMVSVHVARAAATAVGAIPKGIPPAGIYGGSKQLDEWFDSTLSNENFLSVNNENNLMKSTITLQDMFKLPPQEIHFSEYAVHYFADRFRVTK